VKSRRKPVTWVESLNETARALSGQPNLIPLERESFGCHELSDTANDALDLLLKALHNEARLTGVGALLARMELLRGFRARAFLESELRQREGDAQSLGLEVSRRLLIIAGMARGGTTAFHQLIARSLGARAPSTAEVLYPSMLRYPQVDACESVTRQDALWDMIDPAFTKLHWNGGNLPAECVPILNASFLSHHWSGCYRIPTYAELLGQVSHAEAYELHAMFTELLSEVCVSELLVLKAPTHILNLSDILRRYPYVRLLIVDRDVGASLDSYHSLLRSLRGMRALAADDATDRADAVTYFKSAYTALNHGLSAGWLNESNLFATSNDALRSRPGSVLHDLSHWLGLARVSSKWSLASVSEIEVASPRREFEGQAPSALIRLRSEAMSLLTAAGVIHV
jgi:hypothetical protein